MAFLIESHLTVSDALNQNINFRFKTFNKKFENNRFVFHLFFHLFCFSILNRRKVLTVNIVLHEYLLKQKRGKAH
jgi:hypothetical protein